MALTYGIESLAVINKGGGLRRLASSGQTTEYLRGDMTWTTFPTSMTPTAHNHAASEINSGTLELARLPRIEAGSIYVGSGTSNDISTLAKGSALQALRTNAAATALEWYTTQWQDGQYGTGSIKTNSAIATGLRSGDEAKPYVYWGALAGQDLKAGGLAGTDQKWMLISPSTVATYAYGGVEYTYNNATANYVFLILIDSADFIGSATYPFNVCRIIANAGTNYLSSCRTILTVGSPITGNVYQVIVTTGSSTAPSGITYTESVSLYAPLKTSTTSYTGNASVASGAYSVASGYSSVASGAYSVASGYSSVASGNFSIASGYSSVASGASSVASGSYSVASGYSSVASGYSSVASGESSVASGESSVASGASSVASGAYSVASGNISVASGNISVASGYSSVASGYSSVASGYSSVASGNYSVASGRRSVASGEDSFASGLYSIASGASQTVIGKYNVADTSSAFIIGNGTSTSARSNCMTVDFSGNMTLAGSIAIGASGDLTIPKNAGANRIAYFDSSGVIKSSASYTLSSFASAGHNHDATYLKLSGGTVTGKITLDTNGGIFKSGWDGNRIAYFVSGDLTTSSDYTTSSFALAGHNHDSEYAAASHTHSDYAASTHNHDSAYSAIDHDHSGTYALADHTHSGYAAADHTHSGYATSTHYHSIPDLYCGVPNIVPGRILISGSGASSNPTWLDAGTNGKILGWTSGAPAWVDAPFASASHNHSATEITSGTLDIARIPTGTSSTKVALGNHTHLYAGSSSAGGAATTATKLAAPVTLTIGSTGQNFDGSANVTWTLADIGASPSTHYHSTGDLTSGTLGVAYGGTGKSSLTANAILLGGATSTGALQQMSLGTERQVLASGGASATPQWLNADEYERFSVGGTAEGSATVISAKTGISEKLVFIDPGAETTPQTVSYFKAPLAANQEYGDRIVIYCCSGNETYKYIILPNGTESFCDLIGGQYTGNIEASYGNKIELVCLPKSGAKAWYVSRIALINNN